MFMPACAGAVRVNPARAYVRKSLQTEPNLLQHEQTGDYIK